MGDTQRLSPEEQIAFAREQFEQARDFTVAVEEEFAILDPETLALTNRFEELQAAAKDTPLEALSVKFENTTGVAYTGSDPVVLAKVLVDFAKEHPTKWKEVGTMTLIPGFMLSELKTAFLMGFKIYLPFLIIDMVIATVLISMGMMMLPPAMISLPFKLLLFVLVNGWHLIVANLLGSFET